MFYGILHILKVSNVIRRWESGVPAVPGWHKGIYSWWLGWLSAALATGSPATP